MEPDARFAYRVGGCLGAVLGMLGVVVAAPSFLMGIFALGFNDNGSREGYETGHGLLSQAQWLGYGGLALISVGIGLFVVPWFVPKSLAPTPTVPGEPEA